MVRGIIIGAFLGFIGAIGFMSMNVKTSQRPVVFPMVATITTIFGAFAGGKIGYNIDRKDKIDESLGLHHVTISHFKVGRFWQSTSCWTDCKGDDHILHTFKEGEKLLTKLDDKTLCNHGNSASSINVSKHHRKVQLEAFEKIRAKYGEEYLKYMITVKNKSA